MSKLVKPYGDTQNDGKVQLSFTLPVEWSEAADEAARQLAGKMGFTDVQVVDGRPHRVGLFVLRALREHAEAIDVENIAAPSARTHAMSMEEIDAFIAERIGRKIRVAGACIGTDAHTVGIDAILNMKGYKGDYGLERYRMFETFNLGSQIAVGRLGALHAGAPNRRAARISGSHAKGQRHQKLHGVERAARSRRRARRVVLICGGPRVTNRLASELGYDAGFGRGTLPSEVAAFIAVTLADRQRLAARR